MGTGVSVLSALKKGLQGWIRTASEPTAACGGNREARLGQRSAFSKPCQGAAEKAASATRKTRRIVRRGKKPLCNSDDRCQRQKQGGAVGAAASGMRVPPKARCSRWEPRPGLLFWAARAIHPRPPKNRNVSKYAAVFFYDTFSCYFCFAHLSEQLCKNTVLHNKPGGGQGEGTAIKGGIPGADTVLHKGQLRGGKLLAVQGFVGFKVKPLAQTQL